ncbi:flavin reductase family protein, partial [Saccharothrix carnea]|uniref:flavin reductase family protein n=1 Tax=Saccharothrix carnea TaxID=1280637 RepID=UPI00363B61C7
AEGRARVSEQPSPENHRTRFRSAMRHLPTSVVIAAGMAGDQPIGMLIGSFTSVSLSPLLVGFLGDHGSKTLVRLLELDLWTFSVLADDDTITPGAFCGPLHERFDQVKWSISPLGTPMIDNAVVSLHCRKHSTVEAGDHDLVLAEVLDITDPDPLRRPLVFAEGRMTGLAPR